MADCAAALAALGRADSVANWIQSDYSMDQAHFRRNLKQLVGHYAEQMREALVLSETADGASGRQDMTDAYRCLPSITGRNAVAYLVRESAAR